MAYNTITFSTNGVQYKSVVDSIQLHSLQMVYKPARTSVLHRPVASEGRMGPTPAPGRGIEVGGVRAVHCEAASPRAKPNARVGKQGEPPLHTRSVTPKLQCKTFYSAKRILCTA